VGLDLRHPEPPRRPASGTCSTIAPVSDIAVIVTARNEADRLPATLAALARAFPEARVLVADDASTDGTAGAAERGGAEVVRAPRRLGKGGAATLAARRLLDREGPPPALVLLCDGDLGDSAGRLTALTEPVRGHSCDLAVAAFANRHGGGFGVAVGFARWTIRRLCDLQLEAPISGQRALRGDALEALLPFAPRFGMEIGMTVDAHRSGLAVCELPLDLEHRATGRTPAGFWHRAHQLRDFMAVYASRRPKLPQR
jgi:glycosyltransferase involved in cell wall biosynthesis